MSIFASKATFMQLGVEQVTPSSVHTYQDCSICTHPLDINIHTATTNAHHQAVRIGVCGHMHGKQCLSAWLDVGNSCPTCKRLLFEASGHTITQTDISFVIFKLQSMASAKRIRSAVARVMGKREMDLALRRRSHQVDMERAEVKEAEDRQDDLMDDDEWVESGDEDFELEDDEEDSEMDDDGDGSSMEEGDEDNGGGVAIPQIDAEPRSGTA